MNALTIATMANAVGVLGAVWFLSAGRTRPGNALVVLSALFGLWIVWLIGPVQSWPMGLMNLCLIGRSGWALWRRW